MDFLRAVAADVWSEHDVVRGISMHALLVQVTGKQLDVATTTVNLLFMFYTELYHQCLPLAAEWFVKLSRYGIEPSILGRL